MSLDRHRSLIISYLTMRRLIGILGISLPIVVIFGGFIQDGFVIQGSISSYYYTNMRDFFVGILCAVSLVLVSYRGYEKIDNIVSNLSGACAFGMIIFPTGLYADKVVKVGMFLLDDNVSGYIHLAFGISFFLLLAFNSIFLFTRREPGDLRREKKRRNLIYRICGIVMLISISCIVIFMIFFKYSSFARTNPVLILESIALLAFGISWLVKGNTLFKDK